MYIKNNLHLINTFLIFVLPFIQSVTAYNLKEGEQCTLENGSSAKCMLAINCPQAIESLKFNKTTGLLRCGFVGLNEIVCCPTKNSNIINSETACRIYSENFAITIEPFIHGGTNAEEEEFPHMAAVGFDENGIISYECGGTLISERYIVTAAHCTISNRGVSPTIVKLGTNNIRGSNLGVEYVVDRIIAHPEYSPPQRYNDIALLHLNRDVVFSNKITPACLHTIDINNTIRGLATGWGILNNTDSAQHSILQKVTLPLVDSNSCNEAYILQDEQRRLPRGIDGISMLCAGTNNGTTDTCTGDSGGPLQVEIEDSSNWSIIGITSFGVGCGGSSVPGVYTKISNYVDWIERIVWPEM